MCRIARNIPPPLVRKGRMNYLEKVPMRGRAQRPEVHRRFHAVHSLSVHSLILVRASVGKSPTEI